jgi:hypothetical protein
MNLSIDPELKAVINATHYRPALSIILPLKANISMHEEMAHVFKITADKAEAELIRHYPKEQCKLIMDKLRSLLSGLVIPPKKRGLALYVSPVFEKAIFLNVPVQEKIQIDESFEIRDLLNDKKQQNRFLLLTFNSAKAKLYLVDSAGLVSLPSSISLSIDQFVNDAPEKAGNFSDARERKRILEDKFLRHVDTALGDILLSHNLPVMVLATEKTIGHYKKITRHYEVIFVYGRGYREELTLTELTDLVAPHLDAWKLKKEARLLERLDEAAGRKLLTSGIKEIWQQVATGAYGLLIVEQNYRFAAQRGANPEVIEAISEPYNDFSYLRDAVDDVIETLLKNGGDVAFVADDRLTHYDHIALIRDY